MIKPAQRLKDIKEYYFSTKLRQITELNRRGKNIINMGIGNPDLSPPENVTNALKKATNDNGSHKYQPYKGINQLRISISDFYKKKYNVSLDSDKNILPLIGSKEGIMHISLAFLNKGDKVLIPNPGYPSYQSITKLVGAEPLFYPLLEKNSWLPDLDSLKLLISDNVKLRWINYPNMPTGKNSNIDFFKKIYPLLYGLLSEKGGLILLDQRNAVLWDSSVDLTKDAINLIDRVLGDNLSDFKRLVN